MYIHTGLRLACECTQPSHTQSLSQAVLWKSSTKCPGSGGSSVPTDRTTVPASAMPVECPPIQGDAFVPRSTVLSCPPPGRGLTRWPADPLPRSLNDRASLYAAGRWPAYKVEHLKGRITVLQESVLLSACKIFSLCRREMHNILTLPVGGRESFVSDDTSFDFRKAHLPFPMSAAVSAGKQHEGSKTKTHTLLLPFVSLWICLPLWHVVPSQFALLCVFPL